MISERLDTAGHCWTILSARPGQANIINQQDYKVTYSLRILIWPNYNGLRYYQPRESW